jgi:hypothetical protein
MGFAKGEGKFQKGQGGRPKGARNKVNQEFRKVLQEKNFCAATSWLEILKNAKEDYKLAKAQFVSGRFSPMEDNCYKYMQNLISIMEKITSYSHPKLKSIEQVKDINQDRPLKDIPDEELDQL